MYNVLFLLYLFSVIDTLVTSTRTLKWHDIKILHFLNFFFQIIVRNLLFYVKPDKKKSVLKNESSI